MAEDQDKTNKAILDQLVYIDNFIGEDNELNFDLSAFADDSFIFADEDKPNNDKIDEMIKSQDPKRSGRNDDGFGLGNGHGNSNKPDLKDLNNLQLNNLPRFPVPPGAKNSLQQAGLNQNQIDLLSALIAQYQSVQESNQQPNGGHGNHLDYSPLDFNVGSSNQHQTGSNDSPNPNRSSSQAQNHLNGSEIKSEPFDYHMAGLSVMEPNQMYFHNDNNSNRNEAQNASSSSTPSSSTTSNFSATNYASSSGTETKIDSELDKRRRNTAASARFRIKKKLKEKQMEDKIANLQELIKNFESKIQTLELENKLLKNLIIDKGSEKSDHEFRLFKESILNKDKQENR